MREGKIGRERESVRESEREREEGETDRAWEIPRERRKKEQERERERDGEGVEGMKGKRCERSLHPASSHPAVILSSEASARVGLGWVGLECGRTDGQRERGRGWGKTTAAAQEILIIL